MRTARLASGPAMRDTNVPLPGRKRRLDRGLAFVQLRNSADGQQDDGFSPKARAPGHQGVTEFMSQDAGEDDPYQGQTASLVRRSDGRA